VTEAPRTVSRSTLVAAPAQQVWELVSDLPAMGEYSPENTGGRWLRGATGPTLGAVFRGRNRRGLHRWSTRCTVTRCEPGRAFAFAVASAGLPVAEWAYQLEPEPGGCRLTETWTDRRGALVTAVGRLVSGVEDRAAFTAQSIEQTLARVTSRAERQD
jgi:uncharacterized protein YndB with AHSA1/START domain